MGSMYMCETLLAQTLLSTGYRKYWPVKESVHPPEVIVWPELEEVKTNDGENKDWDVASNNSDFRERSRSCGPSFRDNRRADFRDGAIMDLHTGSDVTAGVNGMVPDHCDNVSEYYADDASVSSKGFARLNMSTLHTLGWLSGASDVKGPGDEEEQICKMTKVEFRKLQEQVRDVSINLKNKFRTSAYQKLYQRPSGENTNQVYRTQLAASLKAFQQKQWHPLTNQEVDTNYFRCKPVQNIDRPTSCTVRSGTPSRLQRPKSVPASSLRSRSGRRCDTPSGGRAGKYDTLSPAVISDLMGNADKQIYEGSPEPKSPFVDVLAEETKKYLEHDNDDTSTTSGIDSGASENESPSSDEDSEFEPDIDPAINIPQLNLRPEKLDAFYIPEPKRGWRQYDFDMTNNDIPPYEFQDPFPEYLDDLDLRQMARLKWNWRLHIKNKTVPREPEIDGMLDRLVEFEKLQMDTVDWENKRAAQLRRAVNKRNNSAAAVKIKDKRCEANCLQQTCFGDCPEKLVQSSSCENCRQSLCTGTCKEMSYEQRMRQARVEDERPVTPKPPFPRACVSCQKRHNAKLLNANNLVLGSQRFNNVTFTRGQSSLKPKDMRPKTPSTMPRDVIREFEKMNIDVTQPSRPNTSMATMNRPRSRNSMFPGKSFSSQRKNSLTDLDKLAVKKKKFPQARTTVKVTKRPKTAG